MMKPVKRVLVVAYYWPPAGGSGVQRFLKFVKYFRDFGWEPIVYTVDGADYPAYDPGLLADVPEGITVLKQPIWEPYTLYKVFTGKKKSEKISISLTTFAKKPGLKEKIALWARGNLFIPDAKAFWVKPSIAYLKNWLKDNPVDIILTTAPPQSMNLIGLGLQRETGIPWVADWRDPWTDIDFFDELMLTPPVRAIHFSLQRQVLTEAKAVVCIGPSMEMLLQKHVKRQYEVIYNGFDHADLQPGITLSQKFTMTHVGALTRNRNNPFLWEVLGELVRENPAFAADLQIRLIGIVDYNVHEAIKANGLENNAFIGSYVPHNEAVRENLSARVLMLFIDRIPHAAHALTGKFYEYLMARRPILCISPVDGDAAQIIKRSKAGVVCGYDDKATLKAQLMDLYSAFKNNTDQVADADIMQFSRRSLTSRMAEVLDRVIAQKKG